MVNSYFKSAQKVTAEKLGPSDKSIQFLLNYSKSTEATKKGVKSSLVHLN